MSTQQAIWYLALHASLYAGITNFHSALQSAAVSWTAGLERGLLAAVRHLAVEWALWTTAASWLPELVFRACPDLRRVSVVFPSSRRALWNVFQVPARRCKLRWVEGAGGIVAVTRVGRAWETVSMQRQVDRRREYAETQAVFIWRHELHARWIYPGEPAGWFTSSAWDKERKELCLEYDVTAFVQYKRSEDGRETWVEACEDRLLVTGKDGISQAPPILSPEQRGRNPKEWRVNDEDDYLF
ncbi:hypothetical protein C8A05DRAFT_34696 [Staphylotrichum tortipilum]|uniref:Uncharacterized protein n=1 Tax=Staphylotrichum tortipilum TaxID=2831512 RepID=A0AAN6MIN8_9PEZI|nr:hypothetical protein C8A05DRAFT_34696 [Staphylotrichum longicolle]